MNSSTTRSPRSARAQRGHAAAAQTDRVAGLGAFRDLDANLAGPRRSSRRPAGRAPRSRRRAPPWSSAPAWSKAGPGRRVRRVRGAERTGRCRDRRARAALGSGVALAGQTYARAVVHAGRNAHLQDTFAPHLAVTAAAVRQGSRITRPAPPHPWTGRLQLEETLAAAYAARTGAVDAGRRAGPRAGAGADAGLADHGGGNLQLDLGAAVGLFEGDLVIVAQVLTARRTVLPLAATRRRGRRSLRRRYC